MAVSFDLDGTLIFQNRREKLLAIRRIIGQRARETSLDRVLLAVQEANYWYDSSAPVFASDRRSLWREYVGILLRSLDVADAGAQDRLTAFLQAYNLDRDNFWVPTGGRRLLSSLGERGIQVYAVSGNVDGEQRAELMGLTPLFSRVFCSNRGVTKTALFKRLLREPGVSPHNLIHIGNEAWSDVKVPHSLGIQAILFTSPPASEQLIMDWPSVQEAVEMEFAWLQRLLYCSEAG